MASKQKTIWITGASSGIGAACFTKLAQDKNNKFVLLARRADRLKELSEQIDAERVRWYKLDVCDRMTVQKFFDSTTADWQPDILVNSAGLSLGLDKVQVAQIDDWERMIDTNIKGSLYLTRLVLPGMIERKAGYILMLGSLAGHQPYPGGNVYCATKAAIATFCEALKLDLNGTGVRVTSIDPGMVDTEFSKVRFKGNTERASLVYKGMQPLTPEDIAEVIAFCINQPAHVNISSLVLMPTDQSSSTLVNRA
jgi:3-hydroxy acid dehydrogenase / malonic semialdehyde reductase